jgi:hypothetical protein
LAASGAACAAVLVILTGCPFFQPVLTVSPSALSFGSIDTRESFAIVNAGQGTLQWQAAEVVWDGATQEWVAQDTGWLSIDPEKVAGSVSDETDRVFLSADRDGLPAGPYSGAGIRVTSTGGTMVIPVSMIVPAGTGGEPGTVELVVSPTQVTINGLSDTATFTVENNGDALVRWYTEITINADDVPPDTPIQVAAAPTSAATLSGDTTTVTVSVVNPDDFDTTYLNYIVAIRNQADDSLIAEVNVTVDQIGPPIIAVDPSVLDFGTDGYQLSFLVANLGNEFSLLDFAIFRLVEVDSTTTAYVPYDIDADALIAAIDAPKGMLGVESDILTATDVPWQYAREVTVTISRDGIKQDLEYRDLWIGAVEGWDDSGQPIIDTDVEPQKVQLRVAASASVEGATNRSRPPSLMRFVFTLRDKRGVAIDASDETIRDQMAFSIKEDGFPLDPDESSQCVTGPDGLKQNLVLLLDFTGSMYNAGVDDSTNPLAQGEAIAQMVEAGKQFILDLPDTYRISIMEYHDRQQPSHVIHGFDTNKASLIESLSNFTLPVAEHGASEIIDVLYEACEALVQEDPSDLLPFDEADVRSVVFVSDGWDTSSTNTSEELITLAEDSRVRLYPIGFGGRASTSINESVLTQLATKTGGHLYHGGEVGDLTKLLDTQSSLSFAAATVDLALGKATLQIRNVGGTTLTWQALESLDWLAIYPPAGSIPPLHRSEDGTIDEMGVREITVTTASGFPAGTYEGSIAVQSDSGDATIEALMSVGTSGALEAISLTPRTTDAGRLWQELRGQVVLTYTSLYQSGSHKYSIEAAFPDSLGETASAFFEKDGIYYPGDPRAGQITLSTTGIQNGSAEVFVRTDYVPRNITQFRFRFILDVPESLTPNLSPAERSVLLSDLKASLNNGAVQLVAGGLLDGWRLITNEGNGIFSVVTEPADYIPYASFGDMLKLTLDGLGANDGFTVGFRVDNMLYYSPASATGPSLTKYFLYPGGMLNPLGLLRVGKGSNVASPSLTVEAFAAPFDPEAANAWDRDKDSWADFDDIAPDNFDVGDSDNDGVPDLDDPAPRDPTIP